VVQNVARNGFGRDAELPGKKTEKSMETFFGSTRNLKITVELQYDQTMTLKWESQWHPSPAK
jgi:hypothetical protein